MSEKIKNGITELVFILDRSGSMSGLEADTIGGFNSMIKKQKGLEGQVYVSTVLFSDRSQVLHDRVPIDEIETLTEKDYEVFGCTALLDAIGQAICHIKNVHKYARPEDVPERTLFVITTDGMENASHNYTTEQIKSMIEDKKASLGWEFLFLGANIDAVETAGRIGIRPEMAATYHSDHTGTQLNYSVISETVCAFRAGEPIAQTWKAPIDTDFRQRK